MVETNCDNSNLNTRESPAVEYLYTIKRTIPVGYGGYIIGKNGTYKASLLAEYGAQLLLVNDPNDYSKQVIFIHCPKDQREFVEKKIDQKISKLAKNNLETVTSCPEVLKPIVECGKLIPCFVMNMDITDEITLLLDIPEKRQDYIDQSNLLQKEYGCKVNLNLKSAPLLPTPFGQGCLCVALGSRGFYYRAIVRAYYVDSACVYFLDVGKFEVLPCSRLFKMKVKFLQLPFRAVIAKWNNAQLNTRVPNVDSLVQKRFLCDQQTSKPIRIYAYFTHYNCCLANVCLYVPRVILSNKGTEKLPMESSEFVDLLQLLCRIDLAKTFVTNVDLSRPTVNNSNEYYKPRNFDTFYKRITKFVDSSSNKNNKTVLK